MAAAWGWKREQACSWKLETSSTSTSAPRAANSPTVTTDSTGSTVEVHLSQAESGKFWYDENVMVQVNWIKAGERYATEIESIPWKENLIKEVI